MLFLNIGEPGHTSISEASWRVFKIEDPIIKSHKFNFVFNELVNNLIRRTSAGEYYIQVDLDPELSNYNLKYDSYYTCCLRFDKSCIDDEEYVSGYVNEDEDEDNIYIPCIKSIKDLNNPCKKINNQCEKFKINEDSINFNEDIFKSYIIPFIAKPTFKMGNKITIKNVHARLRYEDRYRRLHIEDDITKSKNFITFYEYAQSMNDNVIHIGDDEIVTIHKVMNIDNFKYKYIEDLRIICDIAFKKDYMVERMSENSEDIHISYDVFVNITKYLTIDYVIDDCNHIGDIEDDDIDVESSTKQCNFEFIDDPDE
jgi:hypothetical protein